jgi:hypothetical protein
MHSKAHTALTAALVYIIQGFTNALKGAMNAACVCKLRNGVKKTPQFLLFSMAKGEPNVQ